MVKHVLFVKLKNNSPESCRELKDLFLSMKGRVEAIRDIQVGVDYLHSDRSYDVVLELLVDSPGGAGGLSARSLSHRRRQAVRSRTPQRQRRGGLHSGQMRIKKGRQRERLHKEAAVVA